MYKKLVIPVFLFFFIFSLTLLSLGESKQSKKWEDERISITVDKVERADSFPERLRSPNATYHAPQRGHDFVLIHVTVVEKKDLRIEPLEVRLNKPNSPHLIDDRSEIHWTNFTQFNITFPEKKTGYLVFVMPKDTTPVQLKYVYQYRDEPPKPQDILHGQIDIDLSVNQ
jgi:hypothetical protein